jgi:hypothetical protein
MSSSTNDNQDNTAVQDAVVVAVNSTTVDDDNSGEGGGLLLGRETKVNDDDADVLVDETNKSSADNLSEKECASMEIDLMQNSIRKQLLKNQYRELWGEEHEYQSPNSDQQDIVADETENVYKVNEDIVDKDETETDDVDEDEDGDRDKDEDVEVNLDDNDSYVPGVDLDNNDEDEDDAVCDNNDNADDVGEDKVFEGVIETNNKKDNAFLTKWVNNYNDVVSY